MMLTSFLAVSLSLLSILPPVKIHRLPAHAISCIDTAGMLLYEDFDPTGYEQTGWSEYVPAGATVDEDSTSPLLRGAQSLMIVYASGNPNTNHTFTASGTVYAHFLFRTSDATPSADTTIFSLREGSTQRMYVALEPLGRLLVGDSGVSAQTTSSLADNTTYHVWVRYTKGTGSNAIYSVEFTDNTTLSPSGSGSAFVTTTAGTSTTDVNTAYFIATGTGTYNFDQLRISSSSIGSVCQ